MKIEILGIGCAKCITLEKIVRAVVSQMDDDYEVVKVNDILEIMKHNAVSMPGLVINGKLMSSGKVLSQDAIAEYIQNTKENA